MNDKEKTIKTTKPVKPKTETISEILGIKDDREILDNLLANAGMTELSETHTNKNFLPAIERYLAIRKQNILIIYNQLKKGAENV